MNDPKRLKRVVIKEEFVVLTGDYRKALILNQFLYWTERVRDFDELKKQEQDITLRHGDTKDIELNYGWIYKTAKELSSELMIGLSDSNIRRHLKELVDLGFISERKNPNPKYNFDKTLQYKVNIYYLQKELQKLEFVLDGYTFITKTVEEPCDSRISVLENRSFVSENGTSILENGSSKIEEQYQRLHTKITTNNSKSSQSQTEPKIDLAMTFDNDTQPYQQYTKIKKEPINVSADQSNRLQSSFENTQFEDDYSTYKEIIQENIEYSYFLQNRNINRDMIDELVNCMLDVICTKGETVKINGEDKNRNMVKSVYLKINSMDIEHVLDRYKDQYHKITHHHNYLKTMLYTVKQEVSHFYTNLVNKDTADVYR